MAVTAPQPESAADQIQRLLDEDRTPNREVSKQTSDASEEADPEEIPEETETPEGDENAHVEGEDEPESGIESLSDLAKHLELEEEVLAKHLKVTGRDGQPVSLHEVLNAYRAPAPEAAEIEQTRARLQELEAGREAAAEAVEELRQAGRALAAHLKSTERTPAEWEKLRTENPAAFLNARLERFEQERQLQNASLLYERQMAQAQAEQQRQFQEIRRSEALKLKASNKAWADQATFESDITSTEKYLTAQGYKAEEIQNVTDHRDWVIADKARRWDEAQAKKPAVLEKVSKLPRVIAPGTPSGADRGAGARAAREEAEARARLKQTGRAEDAAALLDRQFDRARRSAAGRALASRRT